MKQGLALGLLLALGLALCAGWMLGREEPGRAAGAQPLERSAPRYQVICTEAQLRAVGESRAALAGHYVLGADITLTAPWKPIGSRLAPFTGSFDGNGHVIRGLSVPRSGPGAGMFGFARGARITGVALEGATIRGGCLLPIVARGHGNTVTACSINEPRDAQRVLPMACGAAAL